jgi:ATP-dependent DNA ligase
MHYSPAGTRLSSRHLTDMTFQFPEMSTLRLNARDAIIDSEIAVLDVDNQSKPSFQKTMQRFQASEQKVLQYSKALPACIFAFDILQLNGETLIHKKLTERLEILKEVIQPSDHLVLVESYEDGEVLFEATNSMGLEEIVSKPKDSPYLVNQRALWVKNKHYTIDTVEVIGIRKGEFGWLLSQDGSYLGITELVPAHARKAFWHVAKQIIKDEDKKFYYLEPHFKIKVKSIGRTSNNLLRTPSLSSSCWTSQ